MNKIEKNFSLAACLATFLLMMVTLVLYAFSDSRSLFTFVLGGGIFTGVFSIVGVFIIRRSQPQIQSGGNPCP